MFHVTGGLVVFQNYILCAANRADDDSECIFAFDLSGQLDLDTASSIPTQRVLLLNLRCSRIFFPIFILFIFSRLVMKY